MVIVVYSTEMASGIAKVMIDLSLEEEDLPYNLPDLSEFCSIEKNTLSLIGRLLNPDCQKMFDLILDMPKKWQLYNWVRGVSLSKEMFQFIFKYDHYLEDIINKGVHTFNQWVLAIEKWVEVPQVDYLKFIKVWVQIRNIPVNHYTIPAITALGKFTGQVIEVAYDPEKSQNRDFVRVQVNFDVSKPLRRSKVVNLPSG